jgi:hypothetical protein
MRFFRTPLHAYVALVLLACLLIAGIVILLLPRERVTRANFEKIQVPPAQPLAPAPPWLRFELTVLLVRFNVAT